MLFPWKVQHKVEIWQPIQLSTTITISLNASWGIFREDISLFWKNVIFVDVFRSAWFSCDGDGGGGGGYCGGDGCNGDYCGGVGCRRDRGGGGES